MDDFLVGVVRGWFLVGCLETDGVAACCVWAWRFSPNHSVGEFKRFLTLNFCDLCV